MAYTIAFRDRGKTGNQWLYIAEDLSVNNTAEGCKPLSRQQALVAAREMKRACEAAGRPVVCRIARLVHLKEV